MMDISSDTALLAATCLAPGADVSAGWLRRQLKKAHGVMGAPERVTCVSTLQISYMHYIKLHCILSMCGPRDSRAVVKPRWRRKSNDTCVALKIFLSQSQREKNGMGHGLEISPCLRYEARKMLGTMDPEATTVPVASSSSC